MSRHECTYVCPWPCTPVGRIWRRFHRRFTLTVTFFRFDDCEPGNDADEPADEWFCGCCGADLGHSREILQWCEACEAHLAPEVFPVLGCPTPAWDRTWFAQHGTDCPYEGSG